MHASQKRDMSVRTALTRTNCHIMYKFIHIRIRDMHGIGKSGIPIPLGDSHGNGNQIA